MKYTIGLLLILTFASCQKQEVEKVSATFYPNLQIQNNNSGFWYAGDNMQLSKSFDTLFIKIKLYTNASDYELVTAIKEDNQHAKVISCQSVMYQSGVVNNFNINLLSGVVTISNNSCLVNLTYGTGNTQQYLGK